MSRSTERFAYLEETGRPLFYGFPRWLILKHDAENSMRGYRIFFDIRLKWDFPFKKTNPWAIKRNSFRGRFRGVRFKRLLNTGIEHVSTLKSKSRRKKTP